ncbi:MAG: hypothetical protein ABFD80_10105 [Acidobacteriota bacterium]
MTKSRALAVLIVLAALLSWPCRISHGLPGVELSVVFPGRVLTDNLFVDVTFRFRTKSFFAPPAENGKIVSRLEFRRRTLFVDEWAPPVPTSEWKPASEYTVVRRVYIPPFIDEFDPGFAGAERPVLTTLFVPPADSGPEAGRVLSRRKIKIMPAADSPVIVRLSGWYEPEAAQGSGAPGWRWTSKEARADIDNPGRDALLVIRGETGPGAPPGQKVTVGVAGRVLEEFVPGAGAFERSYAVKKEWLGEGKNFELVIAVDKTFVPAKTASGSSDLRELGVKISLLYFR